MKSFIALSALVLAFSASTARASFFEVCALDAQVVSVELLPTLNGSNSAVPGVSNTYNRLVTIHVTGAGVPQGEASHGECLEHSDQTYKLMAKEGDEYVAGQNLKIALRRNNSLTPNGVAHQDTWSVIK